MRGRTTIRRSLCVSLCGLILAAGLPAQNRLRIRVIEGDNAIHNIRGSNPVDLRVRIQDPQGQGIPNVPVTFSLPPAGAGGTFADGGLVSTVTTDADGTATARGFRPNRIEGRFPVRISAAHAGVTARQMIMQTNAAPQPTSGSKRKLAVIAAVVAGAVIGGILLIKAASGSSDSSNNGPFGR